MTMQPELPLVDPLEPRILPQDRGAWFTVNRLGAGGHMRQHAYRLQLLETVLGGIGHAPDVYMSQGLFAVPVRRAVHLAWMTHAYLDLDTYDAAALKGLSPDEITREILWHCADTDTPPPSVILTSGRGFYAKWFWAAPIARAEAGRAYAVNRALARRFQRFRADPNCVDVSRVLRVAGTVNSKNARLVDIVWMDGPTGAPTTYEFDAFAQAVLPPSGAADDPDGLLHAGLREARREMSWRDSIARKFNREHWHWGVLEDIRALAAARYPGGIVLEGERDLYGHLAACQLARVIMPGPLFHEVVATARTFLPAGYIEGDFRRHCSTLLQRATDAGEGQLVTFRNQQRTPIYTYSKTRMMDLLRIEPAEERGMTRLISDAEKYRRRVEARRAGGMVERSAYEAAAAERRERAQALRNGGLTWAEVARRMDLPSANAARVLATRT